MANPLEEVAQESLAAIQKAQTSGILEATGAWSYDLTGLIHLIPVVTKFRDILPREASNDGSPVAIWRASMNVNAAQLAPTPGLDNAANEVQFLFQNFQANYMPVSYAGFVTQDSFDFAKGLFDPYADATFSVLNQALIGEDRTLIGGQGGFALPQPPAPTLTVQTTGGSLTAAAVYVAVAARTAFGFYYGGNSRAASANTTPASGSTNVVTATIAAVKGAVAYDWFYSANGTTWYYYTTTTTSSVQITHTIAANQSVPGPTVIADLSTWVPTISTSADNGSQFVDQTSAPAAPDGFIPTLTADYTAAGSWATAGTATANPATYVDNAGGALTLTGGSITQIENVFVSIWNAVKCSPTAVMVNAAQEQEISNLVLSAPSAVTYLQPGDAGRTDVTAGGRISGIVNAVAGTVVPLEVHPNVPPGTILFRTDRVPFPQSGVSAVNSVRTLRDMTQFDYGINRNPGVKGGGPRKEFEIRSMEAFINRVPAAQGILTNVA